MTYKVSSEDSFSLLTGDSTEAILQNVSLILATRKGDIPLYRDFGLEMAFLDRPMNVAKTLLFSEIYEALQRFEPRARLIAAGSTCEEDGTMRVQVEVEIDGAG